MGFKRIAKALSASGICRRGRELWEKNRIDLEMPLSKWDKVFAGLYLVLSDYADGRFPPRTGSRDEIHGQEINFGFDLPGMDSQSIDRMELSKPFWAGSAAKALRDSASLFEALKQAGIYPPMKILEIGCGSGWLSEFLARAGFDVTGTSLTPRNMVHAAKRIRALSEQGVDFSLQYKKVPMESLSSLFPEDGCFDAVVVYEALHHAHDRRAAVEEAGKMLRLGGTFFILSEPNQIHTVTSYRMAVLTDTLERGFNPAALRRVLRASGFGRIRVLKNRFHFGVRHLWIAAEKTCSPDFFSSGKGGL